MHRSFVCASVRERAHPTSLLLGGAKQSGLSPCISSSCRRRCKLINQFVSPSSSPRRLQVGAALQQDCNQSRRRSNTKSGLDFLSNSPVPLEIPPAAGLLLLLPPPPPPPPPPNASSPHPHAPAEPAQLVAASSCLASKKSAQPNETSAWTQKRRAWPVSPGGGGSSIWLWWWW